MAAIELILNGIGLIADISGLYSFISGFSFERDFNKHQATLARIENLNLELVKEFRNNKLIIDQLVPAVNSVVNMNKELPFAQVELAKRIENNLRRANIETGRRGGAVLSEVEKELNKISHSISHSKSEEQKMSGQLVQDLIQNPFLAGIPEFYDITETGLAQVHRQIITPQMAPLQWRNPIDGRHFFAPMPLDQLKKYGVDIQPPKYTFTQWGHAYSSKHGLYVPQYMIRQ